MPVEDLYQSLLDADRDADERFSSQEIGANVLPCGLTQHYLAVQLLDDEEAVAHEPYRLTLPDGEIRTGRLSALGRVRVDDITCAGHCLVAFPDLDAQSKGKPDDSDDNGIVPPDRMTYLPGATQRAIATGAQYTYVLPDWDVVTMQALSQEEAQVLPQLPVFPPDKDEEEDEEWDLVAIVAAPA